MGIAIAITSGMLRQVMPNTPRAKRDEYLPFINAAMLEFGITTELRAAAFLAQLAHESAELRYMEEIASGSAYEGRRDLGNTEPGDGRRFKGRGPIQLTGRANYRRYGELLGLNLVREPTLAASPEVGFRIAGQFWELNRLNYLADRRQFKAITKAINGGYNGLDDRLKYYDRALRVLPDGFSMDGSPQPLDEGHPDASDEPDSEEGAKGVTTQSSAPASETSGTQPPVPAVEVKPSQVSLFTRLTSLSIPAGATAVVGAVAGFAKSLPPYAWFAMAGIVIAGMVMGYLVWRDSKKQANDRTLKLMDAAADQQKNNVRLV